jgi:hypothetical protein
MRQVTVQLFNGIGNQLFQYAAGRSLASRLGAALRLVHHDPQSALPGRPLLLQQFDIDNDIERMNLLDRLMVSTKPQFRLPGQIVRSASRTQVFFQHPDKIAQPFEFALEPSARSIYLTGYFQEYGLVSQIEPILRRELVLRSPLHWQSQQFAERIRSARRPISVHLRRGDYLTTFGPNGVLSMSYYERALVRMREQFADSSFFVFSDDVDFAKFWAGSQARMTVIDCNDEARAPECLYLMSLCQHHIIANSTFSWWGAWLNAGHDKQVIAPDDWLGARTSSIRVACPDWQLLPTYAPVEPWPGHGTGARGQRRLNG